MAAIVVRPLMVYIAGPYGDHLPKSEIEANVRAADELGRQVAVMGHIPFIPHKHTWWWEDDPRLTRDTYIAIDLFYLHLCDRVLTFAGWQDSKGAMAEVEEARRMTIPVVHDILDIPQLVR